MDDATEGRLAGLSLLIAQILATLARTAENRDTWIDGVEARCDLSGIVGKPGSADETLAVRAAREQVEDTLRVARELAASIRGWNADS